jgi:hypothetical protein
MRHNMKLSSFCSACSLFDFKNGGFELGDTHGWVIGGGSRKGISSDNILPKDYLPRGSQYSSAIAKTHSKIVQSSNDSILQNLIPDVVHKGQYAFRLEDLKDGGYASVITRQIDNYYCLDICFAWLAVLENGGHTRNESSIMIVELSDTTTDEQLLSRRYDAGVGSGGVDHLFRHKYDYFYTPLWQTEHLAIENNRLGHNFTLTVLAADCEPAGHRGYVYLDSFGGVAPGSN